MLPRTFSCKAADWRSSAPIPSTCGTNQVRPPSSPIDSATQQGSGGQVARGYAQWCADRRRADQIFAKASALRPRPTALGDGLVRIDDHTILYLFPNDARLRRLRWYTNPRKLKRSLDSLGGEHGVSSKSTIKILRYKPERRVVAHIELVRRDGERRSIVLRYSTSRHARSLADVALALLEHGISTPRPIIQLEDDRVGIDEFIRGVELKTLTAREPGEDLAGRHGSDLAIELERFHGVPSPLSVSHRSPEDDLRKSLSSLGGLAAWDRSLGEAAERVAKLLTRTVASASARTVPDVLIHGDLHPKNILVDRRGMLTFVDLERVAVGPADIDLGNFRAHAIALGIRQPGWPKGALAHAEEMIDAYPRRSSRGYGALDWHTAVGLIDQAVLVTRHLEANWRTTSRELLDCARTLLT